MTQCEFQYALCEAELYTLANDLDSATVDVGMSSFSCDESDDEQEKEIICLALPKLKKIRDALPGIIQKLEDHKDTL